MYYIHLKTYDDVKDLHCIRFIDGVLCIFFKDR